MFLITWIKLDIMVSFSGTRSIRKYYRMKWNFSKTEFYLEKNKKNLVLLLKRIWSLAQGC